MRMICLLAHSLKSQMPTTTKRIIPLMRKLAEKGHRVRFQENLAMNEASIEGRSYLLARLKYFTRFFLQFCDDYDLIFASKPAMGVLAYLLSRKFTRPFALDIDDFEGIGALDVRKYGTSIFVRKAPKVFVASKQLYELYQRVNRDIFYLPNTTDLEHFAPEKYEKTQEFDEPTFIWVTGIEDETATFNLVLTSLANLPKGILYIIGRLNSNHKKYCEELSRKLGLEKRVVLKRWVPDNEVPRLYKSSDIGLIPYRDNMWTRCKCPSRLFEFMAMELPFICTVGEPAYMAEKTGCGLIAELNTEDFTKKMKYMIDHLDEMKEKAKQARSYLLKSQNFGILAEKLEKELKVLIQ